MPTVQKKKGGAWKPHTGHSEDLSMPSEKELLLLTRTKEMLVTVDAEFVTYNSEHTFAHLKPNVSWKDYEDHQTSSSMVSVLAELGVAHRVRAGYGFGHLIRCIEQRIA